MRRRDFITALGAAATWPIVARAQQPAKMKRIAFVHPSNKVSEISVSGRLLYRAFFEELSRLGYVEGQNLGVERYSGEGRPERYAELARDVVNTHPDLILAVAARLSLDFKMATTTIPIVSIINDPRPLPVIGFLSSASADLYTIRLRAFHNGLKDQGYVVGQNVAIEYRWAEGQNNRLPVLAAELVHRQVDVIAAGGGTPSAVAAKAATATIPIVFAVGVDPIRIGLVASLNRPGGNLTGITSLNVEVGPKRLQLLRELIPTATIIALLINPTNPSLAEDFLRTLQPAASTLGLLPILRRTMHFGPCPQRR